MRKSIWEQLEEQRLRELRAKLDRRHLPVEALMEFEKELHLKDIKRLPPDKDGAGRILSPGRYEIKSLAGVKRGRGWKMIQRLNSDDRVANATFTMLSNWEEAATGVSLPQFKLIIITKEDMDAVDPEARIENPCIVWANAMYDIATRNR